MKAAQEVASALKSDLTAHRNRRDVLNAELRALGRDAASTQEQLKICESAIARMGSESEAMAGQHDKVSSGGGLGLGLACYFGGGGGHLAPPTAPNDDTIILSYQPPNICFHH